MADWLEKHQSNALQTRNEVLLNGGSRDTPLRLYQNSVSEHISDKWKPSDSVEKKWCVLRDSIVGAASDVLGHRQRKQHDWYTESLSILEPLIAERNNLYSLWLQHGRSSDLQNFKNARSNTRARCS